MGSLGRRVEALEARAAVPEDERQRRALREFLARLTDEELRWHGEPGGRAAALVPCPRFEPRGCDCACPERERRGLAAHPELEKERWRRWRHLHERRREILARPTATGKETG